MYILSEVNWSLDPYTRVNPSHFCDQHIWKTTSSGHKIVGIKKRYFKRFCQIYMCPLFIVISTFCTFLGVVETHLLEYSICLSYPSFTERLEPGENSQSASICSRKNRKAPSLHILHGASSTGGRFLLFTLGKMMRWRVKIENGSEKKENKTDIRVSGETDGTP